MNRCKRCEVLMLETSEDFCLKCRTWIRQEFKKVFGKEK